MDCSWLSLSNDWSQAFQVKHLVLSLQFCKVIKFFKKLFKIRKSYREGPKILDFIIEKYCLG